MKYYGITYNEQITSDMRVSYATAVIVGGLRNVMSLSYQKTSNLSIP